MGRTGKLRKGFNSLVELIEDFMSPPRKHADEVFGDPDALRDMDKGEDLKEINRLNKQLEGFQKEVTPEMSAAERIQTKIDRLKKLQGRIKKEPPKGMFDDEPVYRSIDREK